MWGEKWQIELLIFLGTLCGCHCIPSGLSARALLLSGTFPTLRRQSSSQYFYLTGTTIQEFKDLKFLISVLMSWRLVLKISKLNNPIVVNLSESTWQISLFSSLFWDACTIWKLEIMDYLQNSETKIKNVFL